MSCPRCGQNRPQNPGPRPGGAAPQRPLPANNGSVVNTSDAIRNAISGLRYVPPTR